MLSNVCEKLKFSNLKIQLRDGNQEIEKKIFKKQKCSKIFV